MVAEHTEVQQNSLWYGNLSLALCWNMYDLEAVRFFKKAIELERESPVAYYGLCNSYCALGDYVRSIEMGVAHLSLESVETLAWPRI